MSGAMENSGKCSVTVTDKQLVELIHVDALDVLGVHPPSSLRYQSVTLFLRGIYSCISALVNTAFFMG